MNALSLLALASLARELDSSIVEASATISPSYPVTQLRVVFRDDRVPDRFEHTVLAGRVRTLVPLSAGRVEVVTPAEWWCDDCDLGFRADRPDPEGTNQDVACPTCHRVETHEVSDDRPRAVYMHIRPR